MKPSRSPHKKFGPAAALLCACLVSGLVFWNSVTSAIAQTIPKVPEKKDPAESPKNPVEAPGTNAPAPLVEAEPSTKQAGPPEPAGKDAALTIEKLPAPPAKEAPSKAGPEKVSPSDEIQLSFQGANIDMIVQWLGQTTGKTVVKHPKVQCQITIMGSKKIAQREALTLVYRALSLEGFTAIESSKSILIVPEGQEPKMSPELLGAAHPEIPEGRQRLVKIFPLKFIQAAELKEKVKGLLSEKATIETDDRANQVIVTDYSDTVALVGELVAVLDTDKPQDMAVRVIALKNVGAQELAREVAPMYQKMSAKSPKEVVEVTANDRSNSLIILSSEANFLGITKLIATLDTEDAQEKVLLPFPLKNADAQDVAKQLQDLYQEQDNSPRYPYFMFNSSGSSKNTKKMSVVADRRRNTLIVQAPPGAMENIGKMIKALDEPADDDSLAPRIFPLKYVSAGDIEDILNELFLKKQQSRSYWNPYSGDPEPSTTDRDVGKLYGKVRITSEPYANAIILTSNSAENMAAVEEVLKQLDVPSQAGETTFRVGLRFAKASTVANSINILFAKGGSPPLRAIAQPGQPGVPAAAQPYQQQSSFSQNNFVLEQEAKEDGYFPWLGGQPENGRTADGRTAARPVSDLVGRVRVVPDQRSNSLLISANVHFFPQVLKLIEDLDEPTAQVLIEAKIVEVSSDFLDKLGVRWSPDGKTIFTQDDLDNSLLGHVRGGYTKGFGGTTTANTGPVGGLPTGLTTLRSGVLDSSVSLDFLVQFLRKNTDATVLAAPQINIEDNESGRIFVGQQVPFINSTLTTDVGGQNNSFTYRDVGVILEVTPHINNTGDVALKIHAESSAIDFGQTLVLGGAIINTRNFRTDLTAKNGQTLVLGGIIQKQVSETLRKTPILGSIPGLGWAFNKKDKTAHEVELIVFLRPKVVRTPEEAKELLEEMDKKAPLIKKWEDEARPNGGKGKSNPKK
jgi:type II secretion system protein D